MTDFILKQEGKHTLSYGFLDDLNMKGTITLYFDEYDELVNLLNFIIDCVMFENKENKASVKRLQNIKYKEIVEKFRSDNKLTEHDLYEGYFFYDEDLYYDEEIVLNNLKTKGYYVANQYNKYYVYAYSIDYVRFEIYSKQCSTTIIDWETDKQNDTEVHKVDEAEEFGSSLVYMIKQLKSKNLI
ncbi:MAG: hypothetical protein Terrestrivirus3_121 [Terrestrivirus sp.]|uniref:Uncharacterized protein n=1 Tax=Terrestrivirus sp. TaxID=2487775 RepID=A0A3G4ZLW6_9VIRU|nr:MAG: hypothetical protein Terrestrivirus3_121 [Terrestrivirus sp.]